MKHADPRLTTQPAAPAASPSDMSSPRHQQLGQAGPGDARSSVQLPQEMLELIVRRTITGETPSVSARQLALLQRVDRGFRAAARSVLHDRDQQEVGRETTRAQIEHLARHSTLEQFAEGMRSIVSKAPDVGIRLRSLPGSLQVTALQVLAEQTHLRSLELDAKDMPGAVQDAVEAMQVILPKNPRLHHAGLSLHGCKLSGGDLVAIANSANLKSLTSLDLGYNAIDDAGVAALANSEHLRLKSLDLGINRIGDAGVTALANSEVARSLTSLSLGSNINIRAQGMAALANSDKLTALTSLDLEGNLFIRGEGVAALANSAHLRLKSLDLGDCGIGDAGATALANGEMASSLTSLSVRGNYIGNAGVSAIADSDKMRNLTSLDLQQNSINAEGARALANSVHLKSLTALNLDNNAIGDIGLAALANSKELPALTVLGAGYNYIGDRGARALADGELGRSLHVLGLRGNDIGDEGVTAMANSENLTSLKSLGLLSNAIGDEGARAVAASDKLDAELVLDLRGNRISDEGESALTARFKHVAV